MLRRELFGSAIDWTCVGSRRVGGSDARDQPSPQTSAPDALAQTSSEVNGIGGVSAIPEHGQSVFDENLS